MMGLLAAKDETFDQALRHLKDGLHLRRSGWSYGAFLRYLPANPHMSYDENVVAMLPRIDMVYVDPQSGQTEVIRWRVSQDDVLGSNWEAYYGDTLPKNPALTRKIPASA